jgi:hypothetical protein
MIRCNNDYICKDDFITYEQLNPEDEKNCIALRNERCTLCDTINEMKKHAPINFNENPIKLIFDENKTKEEVNEFWELLKEKCGIERGELAKESAFEIVEPDYEELKINSDNVKIRINRHESNAYKFINTMYNIAISAKNKELYINNKESYNNYVRYILENEKCSSRIVHDASILPVNIGIFFYILSNSDNNRFCKVLDFINSRPQLCTEGVIEKSLIILESKSESESKIFKQKYLKYKQKYLLLKNKINKNK